MKLSDKYVVHKNSDGVYVVPMASAEFSGFIQGNKSVMTIIECLMKDTTEEEIVKTMMSKYHGSEENIKADVSDVVARLKTIGAIDG